MILDRRVYRPALGCALLLPFALAVAPAFANDLPEPRSLIDRHVAAVGGVEAIAKGSGGTAELRIEIEENGMVGTAKVYAAPNRMVMHMEIAGTKISTGMVDGVSWSIDPMHGPRLIEGEEAESMAHDLKTQVQTFDDDAIERLRTVALADSEGRPCYRVEIQWKDGKSSASCFDPESGFVLSTESVQASPMGEIKMLVHFYDYSAQGGLVQPMKMRMKMGGVTQVMTVKSASSELPPEEVFALPPSIAALMRKAEAAKAAKPEASPAKPAAGGP